MGVGGQHHAPAALPPGKSRYPLYRRLGGPQGRSGRMWKISPLTGSRPPDRPARSEWLYRLSYPGRHILVKAMKRYTPLSVLVQRSLHGRYWPFDSTLGLDTVCDYK